MSTTVKGLNTSEGRNRIRFVNLSERLQQINVDVIHRVNQVGSLSNAGSDAIPEMGAKGCHFQDELERCKDLDLCAPFKRY